MQTNFGKMAFKSKKSKQSVKIRVAVVNFRFIKKFKLILEQNVIKHTDHKISCRSQKCLVQP